MMISPAACPADERLSDLLNGCSSEAEQNELAAHLEACSSCQRRLETLAAGRDSWTGAAQYLASEPAEPSPLLHQALQKLKGEERKFDTHSAAITFDDLALSCLSPSDQPGRLGRLGPYEVVEVLGRGGMGVVFKAFDPELERFVAIKVLAPQLAASEAARRRFAREARSAAAISHENVVAIHSVEETNGLPYLVMQYISGPALQELLDREEVLSVEEIVSIGAKVALGLAAAHAQGLIHRDIKPSNILLQKDERGGQGSVLVKITDFGLARAIDDATLTQSGILAGTPQYMAPEQARGEPLDHRADLFSLGSVLYALCTGQPPFAAANTMAVLRQVSDGRPTPIQQLRADIPDCLAAIIDRLHAKDPAERFPSAAEAANVLGEYASHLRQPTVVPLPRSAASLLAQSKREITSMALIPCPECGNQISDTAIACPHCGAQRQPVSAFFRHGALLQTGPAGYEYRTQATLFGVPWVHVAFGLDPQTGRRRVAKAWVFALGDLAVGGVAVGGASLGVISIGGCAVGLVSFGGLALGILAALGGLGIGGLAVGGLAVGICAIGGGAVGWLAAFGGCAIASKYAVGGLALAEHANDQAAKHFMDTSSLLQKSGELLLEYWHVLGVVLAISCLVALLLMERNGRRSSPTSGN